MLLLRAAAAPKSAAPCNRKLRSRWTRSCCRTAAVSCPLYSRRRVCLLLSHRCNQARRSSPTQFLKPEHRRLAALARKYARECRDGCPSKCLPPAIERRQGARRRLHPVSCTSQLSASSTSLLSYFFTLFDQVQRQQAGCHRRRPGCSARHAALQLHDETRPQQSPRNLCSFFSVIRVAALERVVVIIAHCRAPSATAVSSGPWPPSRSIQSLSTGNSPRLIVFTPRNHCLCLHRRCFSIFSNQATALNIFQPSNGSKSFLTKQQGHGRRPSRQQPVRN